MKRLLKLLLFLLIISLMILGYSRFIAPYGLEVREYAIVSEDLPDSFDDLRIVHFTDLHYLRLLTAKDLNKIIKEINLLKPDLVFFTGDLVDGSAFPNDKNWGTLQTKLGEITTSYGKYAILGDHDDKFRDDIKEVYEQSGFKLLENSSDIIYSKVNEQILISGVSSVSDNEGDIDEARKDNLNDDGYVIALVHESDYADTITDKYPDTDLILAGHSHNGQIRLPIVGAIYKKDGARKYVDPYYRVNDTDLYVSGGLGVTDFNFRLFNSPSINFYRFRKGN